MKKRKGDQSFRKKEGPNRPNVPCSERVEQRDAPDWRSSSHAVSKGRGELKEERQLPLKKERSRYICPDVLLRKKTAQDILSSGEKIIQAKGR